jgi:hypothetical protein
MGWPRPPAQVDRPRRRLIEKDYLTELLNGANLRDIARRERSRCVSTLIEIQERRSFGVSVCTGTPRSLRTAFDVPLV